MKKNYLFLPVILLTFIFTIFLISCSKHKNELITSANEPAPTTDAASRLFGNRGSVTGMILPLGAEVQIIVYNRTFKTSDFYYKKDGSFQIDRIPAGIYTVMIIDPATGTEYTIPDIEVSAGQATSIGIVKLQ